MGRVSSVLSKMSGAEYGLFAYLYPASQSSLGRFVGKAVLVPITLPVAGIRAAKRAAGRVVKRRGKRYGRSYERNYGRSYKGRDRLRDKGRDRLRDKGRDGSSRRVESQIKELAKISDDMSKTADSLARALDGIQSQKGPLSPGESKFAEPETAKPARPAPSDACVDRWGADLNAPRYPLTGAVSMTPLGSVAQLSRDGDGRVTSLRVLGSDGSWQPWVDTRTPGGAQLLNSLERTPLNKRLVPRHVARQYAKATNACLLCGKTLVDTASRTRGFGPACGKLVR